MRSTRVDISCALPHNAGMLMLLPRCSICSSLNVSKKDGGLVCADCGALAETVDITARPNKEDERETNPNSPVRTRAQELLAAGARLVPGRNGGKIMLFDSESARQGALLGARKRRLAGMRGATRQVASENPDVETYYDAVEELVARQTFIAMQVDGKRAPAAFRNVMDATGVDLEARLLRSSEPQAPAAQVLIVIGDAAAAAVAAAAARALKIE